MSIGFAAIFCAMLLTTGCVEKEVKSSHDFSAWKVKAEQLKGYTPVDVADKDVPPGKLPLDLSDDFKPKEFQEKTISSRTLPTIKVSMEMKDVPVDVVIRTLAKAGHVNIIISKNITGITDLNIDAVPWNQVFESILKTFGYDYEWIGDIIRVISTADINNDVGLMEARQSMQLKQREHDLTMLALKSKADGLEPLETIIIPIRYIGSEDLKPLRDNLWNFITKRGDHMSVTATADGSDQRSNEHLTRGGIMIDDHTHSLMIQATAADIARVVPIIKKLDQPVRQIFIEAQIVEANKDTARELGVQWGGLGYGEWAGRNNWIGGPMGQYDTSTFSTEAVGTPGEPGYVASGIPLTHQPPIGNAFNFASENLSCTALKILYGSSSGKLS